MSKGFDMGYLTARIDINKNNWQHSKKTGNKKTFNGNRRSQTHKHINNKKREDRKKS